VNPRNVSRSPLRSAARHPKKPQHWSLRFTPLEDRVNPSPIQFFYIPLPETQTNAAFNAIVDEPISTTQESITAITVTENNSTIWYDHWEDGYEAILGNPQQATTQVWGDGNNANGIAPGFANDPTGLPSGTVFRLRNTVQTPRNLTTQPILFDSPDKLGSDRTLAVSRAQFPTLVNSGGGSVISSAVEVRDTRYYDTNYRAPVGVNTADAGSMFTYTSIFVQAFLDNTRVQIDANNDGDFADAGDRDVLLNQGETIVSGQSVVQGGRVVADKPVQTQLVTGEINANYASRSYTLFSNAQAANDYFTPVGFGGPSDDTSDEVRLYVFNPNAAAIQVRQERDTGTVTTKTIAAGASTFFDVTYNSGTRLFSLGGESFLALGTHDQQGTTHDWGFSLQPTPALSQIAIVGLGVGNSAEPPSSVTNANINAGAGEMTNSSPIFVTTLGDTTLHVDHDNDGTVDQTIVLTRLQSVRLRDTTTNDNDNSGMRIFTTDGTLISVAWGEDGTAPAGSPGFDAGTTIPAVAVPEYYKFSDFAPGGDANGDGFFNEGDTVRYSLRIRHTGTQPISNAIVTDILPTAQVAYVIGSTVLNDGVSTTPIPDSGSGTPFPLDGSGFTVTNLTPGQTLVVSFDAVINTGLPAGFNFILNQSVLAYDIFRLPANDVIDLRGTVGDRVWYDVDGDGVQDAGEPGIAGASVALTWLGLDGVAGGGDDEIFTATTGADGLWSLTNLPAGNYTTAISNLPNGLISQTFGANAFNIPAGQINRSDLDFGYRGTGAIGNFVWLDLDNDAVQDVNEPGLAGASVSLTWAGFDGTLGNGDDLAYAAITTATTAPGVGNFSFGNLPSGNFRLQFTPPTGGSLVAQDVGGNDALDSDANPTTGFTGTIVLAAGASNATVDAGMRLNADLQITKTDGVATVVPGQGVTYTIVVSNGGPSAVAGASIADAVPAVLTGVSWTSVSSGGAVVTSGGTGTGNALSAVADLPSGGSVTFTVSGTLSASFTGTLSNTATVSTPAGVTDPTPGNNSASDSSTTDPIADLQVAKTDGGVSAVPGAIVTYTLTITNNGPSDSGAITLTDPIPGNTSFVSASNGGAVSGGIVTWSLPSLASGASTSVTIQLRIDSALPSGVTQITNTASVVGSATDPIPDNNAHADTTPVVAAPDLLVTKDDGSAVATPGGFVTYTITVSNVGNQDATGVTLSEVVPANTTFVPGGSSAQWNAAGTALAVGSLAVGQTATFFYQVRIDDPFPVGLAQISNTVTATDDGGNGPDPTPGNNLATDTTTVDNGQIGDLVFLDSNGNGVRDLGEAGVPGVTVQLLDAQTLGVLDTVVTDSNGNYRFSNLPAADYRIAFDDTDGTTTFLFSAMDIGANESIDSDAGPDGTSAIISLSAGQHLADIDAGVAVPVEIGDTLFHDADANGTQTAGEPGIPGATIRLFYAGPDGTFDASDLATPFQTATSNANGGYGFDNLPPGSYRVDVDPMQAVLAGYGLTSATTAGNQSTTLVSGGTDADRDFGFTGTSSLGDRVWLDRDADGVQDADEPGIPGRIVTVVWLGFDGLIGGGDDVAYPPLTTGTDGQYAIGSLPLGRFSVSVDTTGTNLTPTFDADGGADGTATIVLTATNPNATDADFGYRGTASIGDRVFQDIDGDGVLDAGTELGIPGTTVTLRWAGVDGVLDTADDAVFTTVTDGDGFYSFDGLPVLGGSDPYRATITAPAGYAATGDLDGVGTPNAATLDLGPTDDRSDVDFGLGGTPGQSIAGHIYHDLDADGQRDAGEPGLPGVVVRLTGIDSFGRPIVDPATGFAYFELPTDANGAYLFDRLVPGTYAVSEPVQPMAFNDGTESLGNLGGIARNDSLSNIPVGGRVSATGYDFGELGATVSGSVFRDDDRDGSRDAGEPGVSGVVVELRDTNGVPVIDPVTGQPYRAVTGPDGVYAFRNVALGAYQIVETQPAGYANGPVGPAIVRAVTVPSAGLTDQNFAEVLGQIAGSVYIDQNLNATRDSGEIGLSGVTVTLTGTDLFGQTVNRTTTTDTDGRYVFANLLPANTDGYTITEGSVPTLNDGAPNAPGTAGGAANGPNSFTGIQPSPDRQDTGYDFGEIGVPVSGTVFIDTDRDGARDAGETPLPGVLIELLDGNGTVVASVTTDANGNYTFPNVLPGDYTIRETQPAVFGNPISGPAAPNVRTLTVGRTAITGIEFADTPAVIVGTVYLDENRNGARDPSEPGIAGVQLTLTGTAANGAPVSRTATTAADGSYRFDDLMAGVYAVAEAQPANFAQGSNTIGTAGGQLVATDIVGAIDLAPGEVATGYLFGEQTLDNTPIPQPVVPLPPLPPLIRIAPGISKQRFLGTSLNPAAVPVTGRTSPDFTVLGSTSTTRDPLFISTAEGENGELVRVFDLTGGQERFRFRPFPGLPGGARVATADVSGDGIPDIIVAAGPGGAPRAIIYDGNTGAVIADFQVFEASFSGGLFVAAGDLNGDGRAELAFSPDVGGGPRVKVLDAGDPDRIVADFLGIDDSNFRGGARTAIGDLNGDGTADVAVGAGVGGGPRVAIWDGASLIGSATATRLAPDFFAYEATLRNGVFLTVADIDGDGFGDLLAGAGPGGAPRVVGFSAVSLLAGQLDLISSYFVGDESDRGGVPLAALDLDGDGRMELLTGAGRGSFPMVRFSDPRTATTIDEFAAESMDFIGGIHVG
jgi:uncharacterized repeat protein (TIGR01451 family)